MIKMKSFKEFLSESVNIQGDFNGNLYINSSEPTQQQVGESYVADITWMGSIYRLELVSEGMPSKQGLAEQLQGEYPGAIVHNIYPSTPSSGLNISNSKRYHPAKLEWI